MELSPVVALVAVWSHSIVLFLFASRGLEGFLIRHDLPPIPLVPVSSSQAIVGAVIGMGLLKGGKGIRWKTVGGITSSWVTTPIVAALTSFICLFFMQNVFQQKTYRPVRYALTSQAIDRIGSAGLSLDKLKELYGQDFPSATRFDKAISERIVLKNEEHNFIITSSEIDPMAITPSGIAKIKTSWISIEQKNTLHELVGSKFIHQWQLNDALAKKSVQWRFRKNDKDHNENLRHKLSYIYKFFRYDMDK